MKTSKMLKTDNGVVQTDLTLDASPLTLKEFNEIAFCRGRISFLPSQTLRSRMSAGVKAVTDAINDEKVVYGINTGFGALADQPISCQDIVALQNNLLSFLAAGCGKEIDGTHVRGAMLLRANVLLQGKSGARIELVQRLVDLLNRDALPIVREFGSIGASGDLIPLSTIARSITGDKKVQIRIGSAIFDGHSALSELGLDPIELQPKEGLALVNGTSFSAAIAANSVNQARQLFAVSLVTQSMLMSALQVDCQPFEAFVHEAKPHQGQVWCASAMRELLTEGRSSSNQSSCVQDRYSLRCFPQYTGAIVENLVKIQQVIETEMNGVSDNPLVDSSTGSFFQSGNFLGQYVAMAMDDLRRDIGLLAKHLDVQIAQLVAPEFNKGLSPSLRGNDARHYNMGLKGLQICGNSIMPMLTYLGQPLTHHFPTHAEQFNQNINGLSWGSANLAWQSVKTFSQFIAISLLFGIQALDLRAFLLHGHFDGSELLGELPRQVYFSVHQTLDTDVDRKKPFLFNDDDRWLERDIEFVASDLFSQGDIIQKIQPILDSFDDYFKVV